MRSQFDFPHLEEERVDPSSGLVCISRLTCMAGQGELTAFPKTDEWISGQLSVHFQFNHTKCNQDLPKVYFLLFNLLIGYPLQVLFPNKQGNILLN